MIEKKVVYIGYAPLTTKTATDFFIDKLIDRKVKIEYWDLTSIYFPNLTLLNTLDYEWIKKISSLKELKVLLKLQNSDNIYFINFPYEWRVLDLFLILTKFKLTINIIAKGMIPLPSWKENSSYIKTITFNKLNRFFKNKIALIFKLFGFVKSFDNIYYAGEAALKIVGIGYKKDINTAKLIPINSSDYDIFLINSEAEDVIKTRYIVFLDEYFPYHPDFEMLGIPTIESEKYYSALNRFFQEIEDKLKLKIVIAAHPKAILYTKRDFFNGRTVLFNQTASLVRHCEFAIAHMSTSISYAVLNKKPVLFSLSNDLSKKMALQSLIISFMANQLKSNVVNIDSEFNIDLITPLDELSYDNYKYRYLTNKNTENHLSSDLFINSIF